MRKGFWRTFESVFAVIILVFFLLTLGMNYAPAPPEAGLSGMGYDILKGLDSMDELRHYAVNNQSGAIESMIRIEGYDHAVQICDFQGACYGNEPEGTNVWVSAYIISGESAYEPCEVRLFVW
jgi:hypothetical protein